MSIIEILKEGYLFEDEDNPVVNLTPDSGETVETDQVESNKVPLDNKFIVSLVNHLDEKLKLEFGSFDSAICNEVRKYMDESDGKEVKKVKERIHKIILDEKRKFLKRIQTRMEQFKVPKKIT